MTTRIPAMFTRGMEKARFHRKYYRGFSREMMKNAKYFVVCMVFAALMPGTALAQTVISEVMYDLEGSDTGREWIEVFNAGASSVTLTEWKLFEADSNHGIVAYSGGESLGRGAYAVIADNPTKFLEDWPTFSGILFDSAFSLSNTGEVLALRCCGSGSGLIDKDSITYSLDSGAVGDGNSLHRPAVSGGSFTPAPPTPGTGAFQASGSTSETTSGGESALQTSSGTGGASSAASPTALVARVSAGSNRTVTVGVAVQLEGTAYDTGNRVIENARFLWNFGDGTSAEGKVVTHRWEYPGRYAVVLEASRYDSTASYRITATAESAQFSFSVLLDGSAVIENLSNRDVDLSGWLISDRGMTFTLPSHTTLLRNASIRLSPAALHFGASSKAELLYPDGSVAFYVADPSPTQALGTETGDSEVEQPAALPTETSELILTDDSTDEDAYQFDVASLDEDVSFTEVPESSEESISLPPNNVAAVAAAVDEAPGRSVLWWVGILLVLGLGALAVFAARHLGRREWNIIDEE